MNLCPLSFWLTLSRWVLSTYWCCPSRPCVVLLPCIISFSGQFPCFLKVWPLYASFLALTVSNSSLFTPALLRTHSFVFFAVHEIRRILLSHFISKAPRHVLHSFWVSSFHSCTLLQATLALSSVVSSLKLVCCDFSISSAVMPWSPAPCLTWYGILSYTRRLL